MPRSRGLNGPRPKKTKTSVPAGLSSAGLKQSSASASNSAAEVSSSEPMLKQDAVPSPGKLLCEEAERAACEAEMTAKVVLELVDESRSRLNLARRLRDAKMKRLAPLEKRKKGEKALESLKKCRTLLNRIHKIKEDVWVAKEDLYVTQVYAAERVQEARDARIVAQRLRIKRLERLLRCAQRKCR